MAMKFFLLSLASGVVNRESFTYVGGCSKGPGAVQTAAGGGQDGTVDGQAPSLNVYKDGFWSVGCKGDAMIKIGDKYGGGKFKYDIGRVANTSVVLYKEVVEGDSQKAMTPKVCFEFCRTVPNMNFFGLIYGRDCYCEHYYQTASAEGTCNLPCEGDSASICGGPDMSSLYQMHVCEGALQEDAMNLMKSAQAMYDVLGADHEVAVETADNMQASGDTLEGYTEGCASDYAQQAKVAAGPLTRTSEGLAELMAKLSDFEKKELPPPGKELGYDDRKLVEETMEDITEAMDASEQALAAAKELVGESSPDAEGAEAAGTFVPVLRQYTPSMEGKQSVCSGTGTGLPKVGLSVDQCAHACDTEAPKSSDGYCVGFQYFSFPDEEPLCFLLARGVVGGSDFSELTTFDCDYAAAGGEGAPGGSPSPDAFLEALQQSGELSKVEQAAGPDQFLQASFLASRKHHHKKHHHGKPGRRERRMLRKARKMGLQKETPVGHVERALIKAEKLSTANMFKGGNTDAPEAICMVRYSDFDGVTPTFQDGDTTIERCFAGGA